MKPGNRWQIEYNFKKHQEKIKNVKSSIPVATKKNQNLSAKKSKQKINDENQINILETLKQYNLQQYKVQLEKIGFEDDLRPLFLQQNLDLVLDQVNFVPGHKQRFKDMILELKVQFFVQEQKKSYSEHQLNQNEKISNKDFQCIEDGLETINQQSILQFIQLEKELKGIQITNQLQNMEEKNNKEVSQQFSQEIYESFIQESFNINLDEIKIFYESLHEIQNSLFQKVFFHESQFYKSGSQFLRLNDFNELKKSLSEIEEETEYSSFEQSTQKIKNLDIQDSIREFLMHQIDEIIKDRQIIIKNTQKIISWIQQQEINKENWQQKIIEILTQTKKEHNITQLQNTV